MKKLDVSNIGRVWELDLLRGIMVLCILAWHLYFTVDAFCIDGYYSIDSYAYVNATDPLHFWFDWGTDGVIYRNFDFWGLQEISIYLGVDTFFVISGISCMLSRDNFKRALRVLGAGVFVAGFTKLLAVWTGDPTRFIRFGVLLCYAFCQLIYFYFLKDKSSKTLLLVSIPVFAVGYYLRCHGVSATQLPVFYIFGVPQVGDVSSDWWPLFPMLGWFLIGVVLGRKFYSEKKTRVPFQTVDRLTRPLQWLGRWSGVIYVSHIVVYTVVFCGIGYLFGLL